MWNRRKTQSRLSRELNQLRDDFDTIYERVRHLRPPTVQPASLSRLMPWNSHAASDAFRGMTHSAAVGANQMSHQLEDMFGDAVRVARQRPVPAGLALLAIGVVLGLALRKSA